jgi:zinc/manganese transport system permease protein
MNLAGLDPTILLPACAAGLLVLASHVPLGQAVLRRGIVFLDLAIAQIAGLGVVLVHSLGGEGSPWLTQTGAVTAALLGALFLHRMEKRVPTRQEAIIGVTFVAAACLALILMSQDPHGAEHLQDLLVGQILWTTWAGMAPLAVVTLSVLAAWFGLNWRNSPLGFYLVFASLIVPALVSRERLARGYLLGATGYVLGLIASGLFDLPSGAAIVLALVGVAGLAALFTKNVAQNGES